MRFYFKHPDGREIDFRIGPRGPRKPREPMESGKFYALIGLAAGALLVAWFLGGIALK